MHENLPLHGRIQRRRSKSKSKRPSPKRPPDRILRRHSNHPKQKEKNSENLLERVQAPVKVFPDGTPPVLQHRHGGQQFSYTMSSYKNPSAISRFEDENERNLIQERNRSGRHGYDNEGIEMNERTPRIVVDQVDDDNIEDEVLVDLAQTLDQVPGESDRSRKESSTSQLTDGSHRSSVSRRLSTSLHIDIDLEDDPEFQVCTVYMM